MYILKTTRLNFSFYDAVPLLCFCWGLVLACHIWLSPQLYLELSLFHAVAVTCLLIARRLVYLDQGAISIKTNQAVLDTNSGRYKVEFKSFNAWRLLAVITPEDAIQTTSNTWVSYFKFSFWLTKLKRALFEPAYLSIYHSMLSKEEFAYLRSFAAYQCHTGKDKA